MLKISNICLALWRRMNWRPNACTLIEILLLALIAPLMLWANPAWFVEDGIVENIQLLVLIAAFIIACRAQNQRPLFIFAAMIVIFLIMRETNMFRGYFCEKYLNPDDICRWKEFKYGFIPEAIRLLLAIVALGYFIRCKLWRPLWKYVVNAPIFVWDFLILGLTFVGGTIAEFPCIDNEILEECCELICYIAVANCIWRYRQIEL